MSEKKEKKEFKHFCDNPECPNHYLPLNNERHYHSGTEGAIGGICGILKTHAYYKKTVIPTVQTFGFIFRTTSHTTIEKQFNFCDICHGAIKFKENNYDQFNY